MSVNKSEIKMATAHEIGLKLDDKREAAQAELHRCEGARSALKQAGEAVDQLMKLVSKEADTFDFPEDMRLKVGALINQWLRRAVGSCISLGDMAEAQRLIQRGKLEALNQAVADVKSVFDLERTKAEALRQSEEMVVGDESVRARRPTGGHPGNPLKDRRGSNGQKKEPPDAQDAG